MLLHETLQICLLSLAARYPDCIIDINKNMFGTQPFEAEGWSAFGLLALLQATAPALLQSRANMRIDVQESNIYLEGYPDHVAAFIIHCRGKLPAASSASLPTTRHLMPGECLPG